VEAKSAKDRKTDEREITGINILKEELIITFKDLLKGIQGK